MSKLDKYLLEFGLTTKEVEIYLSLLSSGPNTILNIAKATHLNRTTVHINVSSLINKGLVSSLHKGNKRLVIADPPEKLKLLVEEEKLKLKNKEDLLSEAISLVYQNIGDLKFSPSSVRTYEGAKAINLLYDEILLSAREVRAYVNFSETKRYFPNNFEKFSNATKNGLIVYDLYVNSGNEDDFKQRYGNDNYFSKSLPRGILKEAMDYLITSNKIVIVYYLEEPKAIVIENQIIYNNAKSLFNLLWELLP